MKLPNYIVIIVSKMHKITQENIYQLAKTKFKENQLLIKKLKKTNKRELDSLFHQLHSEYLHAEVCLECANCCKNISPAITDTDINRIARYLKSKPSEILEQYLYIDKDNDYVFKQSPCPFLGPGNYCSIYPARPKACAEYPHTNRKKIFQILDLTLKNTFVCPVVFHIFETIKAQKSKL